MSPIVLGLLLAYWIYRLIYRQRLRRAVRAAAAEPAPAPASGTSIPDLAQALTDPHAPPLTDTQSTRLRPLVLHWLGLRTDLSPVQSSEQAPGLLKQRWFTRDLQHLTDDTDPHAALAFACLRVAFYLRAAWRLGWINQPLYITLTRLNAQRLRDCFPDWPSFTHACAHGSADWQARGRTDIFGDNISPERLWPWLWVETAAPELPHKEEKEESAA